GPESLEEPVSPADAGTHRYRRGSFHGLAPGAAADPAV
ncbi:MAG: hypothetical protein AVDCRST_MAG89-4761, partial [uncultured Gemmatimonadetes bacterium]